MNQDDQLLKALARLVREQKEEEMRLDPRWESLSHDDLEGEEAADLRSLAESSPQMKAAWEAFRPLDRPVRRRILDRILEIFPQPSRASPRARVSPHPSASPRRRSSRRIPGSWWPLFAAASLSVILVGLTILRLGNPELPEYSLETTGGAAVQRSGDEPEGAPLLMEGVRMDLVLFPAEPVAGKVALAVFLEQGDTLRPWRVPTGRFRAAPTGALKLELRSRDLSLDPGPAVLWLAVARPCCLPGIEEVRELRRDEAKVDSGDIRWLRQEIVLEPPSTAFSGSGSSVSGPPGEKAGLPPLL